MLAFSKTNTWMIGSISQVHSNNTYKVRKPKQIYQSSADS